MASLRPQEREDTHYRLLQLLQENPAISQRELAEKLGLSNGRVHYCLKALVEKGLIKIGNFSESKRKLGYIYLLTPEGFANKAAMTRLFLKRKLAEYQALKMEIDQLQAEIAHREQCTPL